MSKKTEISLSELQGAISLLTDATVGVTDLAEAMQLRIIKPSHLPYTPAQKAVAGVSKMVYGSVNKTAKFIGGGLGKTLGKFNPDRKIGLKVAEKEALVAALNGVVGDRMEREENPLTIPMQLKYKEQALALSKPAIQRAIPKASGGILLVVHGLCMNDLQWNRPEGNFGEVMAKELGMTPLFLHYNTGLHISENGHKLNALLEELAKAWPVPIEGINLLTHSMGGLIGRSACYHAEKEGNRWRDLLRKLVFLGTPHHGAPLEQIGNHIDHFLEAIPYTKPFARLGKMRSAGITDLRQALLLHEDWEGMDRFQNQPEGATHVPLPSGVECYAVAACIDKEEKAHKTKTTLIGDGLVQLNSALGKGKSPDRQLNFKKSNTHTVYQTNHIELLGSQEVLLKLREWL